MHAAASCAAQNKHHAWGGQGEYKRHACSCCTTRLPVCPVLPATNTTGPSPPTAGTAVAEAAAASAAVAASPVNLSSPARASRREEARVDRRSARRSAAAGTWAEAEVGGAAAWKEGETAEEAPRWVVEAPSERCP